MASLLVFVACAAGGATKSDSWLARTWQTDEGLPNNSVTGVAQTDDGYLWVATLGGLMRFNGSKFEEFPLLNLAGVANRAVRRLYLDRRGNLWLAMDRGPVVGIGPDHARVFNQTDGLKSGRISSIAEDGAGSVWLAGETNFFCITKEKVLRFGAKEGVPAGENPWLTADARGRLWFACGAQVGGIRDGKWQSVLQFDQAPVRLAAAHDDSLWICAGSTVLKYSGGGQASVRARLPDHAVATMMFEDQRGVLWIGTAEGLFRLDGYGLVQLDALRDEILCAREDREKNLWIGTVASGLNLLYPKAVHLFGPRTGLPSSPVRSICQDKNNWLWAALKNGSLMYERSNEWDLIGAGEGWPGGDATCVTADPAGGVWIGTSDHGLQHLQAGQFRQWGRSDGLDATFIHALLAAGNGDLWIATHSPDQLVLFRNGQFHPAGLAGEDRTIQALAEGVDETIWAGTAGGQVLRINSRTLAAEPVAQETPPVAVRALHATPDGNLWVGYAGAGLGRCWPGHYGRITTKEGLFDDYISQIQSDDEGALWLTSDRGLFQVREQELLAVTGGKTALVRSIIHGRNEGLHNLQPAFEEGPNSWLTADKKIWFATSGGLLLVKPERIPGNTKPPPVVLERVAVDDGIVALWDSPSPMRTGAFASRVALRTGGATLTLTPDHRKVEFDFAALSFTSPENVNYRYRLQGFDTEWIATAQRSAIYQRLPAGHYVFEVRACNNAGVWNATGYSLALTVPPFFWETWWFRALVLAGFIAGLVWLVRYYSFLGLRRKLARLKEQAALQKERARIARDIHDEVGSKLSRLSLLSELAGRQPGLPAAVRGDVTEISETTRDTIRSFGQIIWAVNPKNDTLANLANYLCRFAEEFFDGSSVECIFDLPDAIPDMAVSTELRHHLFLAVKEALNNVLKHACARQVCLRLAMEGDGFEIVIEDDGRGLSGGTPAARHGSGNGLENMQTRMQAVGGQVSIRSRPGAGTCVTFRMQIHQPMPA